MTLAIALVAFAFACIVLGYSIKRRRTIWDARKRGIPVQVTGESGQG